MKLETAKFHFIGIGGIGMGTLASLLFQPGVHRPHRHLDPEGQQEGEEHQRLRGHPQRGGVPGLYVETASGLKIQIDHRHQHQ